MGILQMNIISVCKLIMELCNIGLVFSVTIIIFYVSFSHHGSVCALLYMIYELCSKGKLIYRLVQKFLDTECLTHCL